MRNIIFVVFIIFISSCDSTSCDDVAKNFIDGYECNLIIKNKIIIYDNVVQLKGLNPMDGHETTFTDGSKWLLAYFDEFKIGDTILKAKGSGTVLIKRKEKVIPIYYTCGEKPIGNNSI